MKNQVFFLFVLSLFGGLILQSSCTKNKVNEDNIEMSTKDQILEKKTLSFLEEYELFKVGRIQKTGEEVPITEAITYIDETFNYTYSFPITTYTRFHFDTTYIEVPITSTGKVYKYCDLFSAYDNAVSTIRALIEGYQETDKRVIGFQITDLGINPQTGNERFMLFSQIISGTGMALSSGEDFYFAKDSYYCDGMYPDGGPYGGANIVQDQTNFVLRPVPPPPYRIWFTGSPLFYLPEALNFPANNPIDNFEDYYIFYGSSTNPGWIPGIGGTKCMEGLSIPDSELDFYITSLVYEVINVWLNDPQQNTEGRAFEFCTVNSENPTYPIEKAFHTPSISFRFKHIGIGPSPYPIALID